jgi:hypothetical protein
MFNIGDRVLFGRGKGEKTLGEVVKVNRKNLKIKTLESRGRSRGGSKVGAVWNVPPRLCELAGCRVNALEAPHGGGPKRSEEAILMDIRGVYAALNTCGSLNLDALARKLDGYFAEFGLEVFKSEAFDPAFLEAVKMGNGHLRAEYVEEYRKSRGENP